MKKSIHVLIVDDNREIRDLLAKYLSKNKLLVHTADGGVNMRKNLAKYDFDLIVLDLMMPGEDGLSLCREIRKTSTIPIIMLTALGEETDRVVGLEIGADDYITKPFSARELLIRIKKIVQRAQSMPYQKQNTIENKLIYFDKWVFDQSKRQLIDKNNVIIALSGAEYRLLNAFVEQPQRTLSRDTLMEITRGHDASLFDRSIDNQVSRLRKKIEADITKPQLIKTVWGVGYIFTSQIKQ